MRQTENTAIAMPATTIRMPRTARTMPARLVSVSSIGRRASSGVTEVAERAEPRAASMVMMMPKMIGTTNTCREKMSRMPCRMTLPAHMPHMMRLPNATPSTDEIRPSAQASNRTERYSCPFFAPMVRSRASVRRRCATSTGRCWRSRARRRTWRGCRST